MRFLLVTSRSRRMFDGGRSFAIRFMKALRLAGQKGVEFYTIGRAGCVRRVSIQSDFLMLTDGIWRDSLYFAMVRRATTIPCCPRISEILLSDRGLFPSSAAISCLIRARIAVAEHAP